MKGEYISIETLRIIQDLEKENKELQNIIKEVREYIYKNSFDEERKEIIGELWKSEINDILEILDRSEK